MPQLRHLSYGYKNTVLGDNYSTYLLAELLTLIPFNFITKSHIPFQRTFPLPLPRHGTSGRYDSHGSADNFLVGYRLPVYELDSVRLMQFSLNRGHLTRVESTLPAAIKLDRLEKFVLLTETYSRHCAHEYACSMALLRLEMQLTSLKQYKSRRRMSPSLDHMEARLAKKVEGVTETLEKVQRRRRKMVKAIGQHGRF